MTTTTSTSSPHSGSGSAKVRVAIVGSGLTGLVAAYLLSSPNSDVESAVSVDIFERAPTLGMDSASISVALPLSVDTMATPKPSSLRSRSTKRRKSQPQKQTDKFLRIDVPMRAFTGGYYPNLLKLYKHLGIRIKKTNFTYSFAALPPQTESLKQSKATTPAPTPTILYNGANGVRGVSIPSNLVSTLSSSSSSSSVDLAAVLAQVVRLRTYFGSLLSLVWGYLQLLVIAVYHNWTGHTSDASHPVRTLTLKQLVHDPFPVAAESGWSTWVLEAILRRCVRLGQGFADETLAPLMSAVMTCSLDSVWSCPAGEVLDYVALTLGKDHFVVRDGVRTVVAALVDHLDTPAETKIESDNASGRVWTDAEVRRVTYRDGKAWVVVIHHNIDAGKKEAAEREHGPFDHVIFATQANQTAHFLEAYQESIVDDDETEAARVGKVREALGRFKYERATVVNHTDRTLLPAAEADWRDLNLVTTQGESTMATHILRLEQEGGESEGMLIMQSTNPLASLQSHAATVLSKTTFERAVLDVAANQARQHLFTKESATGNLALGSLQASQQAQVGVWVGGSWASGIPLLEGCVVSAQLIAQSILSSVHHQSMQH